MTDNAERFLRSADIPNPRARWCVLTGIAHDLTDEEMSEVIARMMTMTQTRLARLRELDAPQILIRLTEERLTKLLDGTETTGKLFARVRASRVVKGGAA